MSEFLIIFGYSTLFVCIGILLAPLLKNIKRKFIVSALVLCLVMIVVGVDMGLKKQQANVEPEISLENTDTDDKEGETETLELEETAVVEEKEETDELPLITEPFIAEEYNEEDYQEWNHDKLPSDTKVRITGKVLQSTDNDGIRVLRVAVNDDYDQVVMVGIAKRDYKDVIAEDDNITVYGRSRGITSYTSTLGAEITVPLMLSVNYTINSYGN